MTEKLKQRGSLPCHMKAWALFVMFMFVVSMIPARTVSAATNISLGVKVHTPDEIRQYIKNNGVDANTPTTYSVTPSLYNEPGELDDETKNNALKMLNNFRYVLGLSPVALDEDMGKKAQAAAFVDDAVGQLTHYPEEIGKPSEMDQDIWDLGEAACKKCNLAWASPARPLNDAFLGWMADNSSNNNISIVGHRRWIMNPTMTKSGFGSSRCYSTMYSHDTSGSDITGATIWPAKNTPYEYFEKDSPWNIGLGQVITNVANKTIHVELIRERDGKTWNFTQSSETPVSGQDYYHIHNLEGGYFIGRKETNLIFRPADPDIQPGDVFQVKVTGDVEMNYKVNFFALKPIFISSARWEIPDVNYTGEKQTPEPVLSYKGITLKKNVDYIIIGYGNNINAGRAVVTIEGIGNYTGRITCPFAIKPLDINSDSVTVDYSPSEFTYNGEEQKPAFTVKFGENELKPAEDGGQGDYTLAFENNINAGKATATITGQGNFSGEREVTFTINPKPLTKDMLGAFEDVTYNGKAWTPEPAVKDGETLLKADGDYKVSYKNNVNVGEAAVTVAGINNYSGEISGTFSIKQMDLTMAVKDSSKPYGDPDPRSFAVEITPNLPEGQAAHYQVERDEGEVPGEYKLRINPDSVKIELEDVDNPEDVTANYNISYKNGTFTIKNIDISEGDFLTISDIEEMIYSGKEICPEPDVFWNGKPLKAGEDIEFSYDKNVNAGEKAEITITGKERGYIGSKTFNFTIKPANIEDAKVDPFENPVYNGKPQEPAFRVTYNGVELVPSGELKGDYTIEYFNNVNVGERTKAELTGQRNFTGTKLVTFAILPKSLKDCTLGDFKDVTYNGKEWTPDPVVKDGKTELVAGEDYTVSYKDNVNAGKAAVIVTGKNNYTDELSGSFAIEKMDLTVKAKDMSKPYQTDDPETFILETKPELPEGQILVSGPVTREEGEEIGEYAITFKPDDVKIMSTKPAMEDLTGNYKITCQNGTFTIGRIDITNSDDLTISEETATYTGEKVTIEPKVFWQGRALDVGKDVTLSFDKNVNAGKEAVVTVTGTGKSYYGSKSFNFTIEPADISGAEVEILEKPVYNGKKQEPKLKATFNGKELKQADEDHKGDYTVEYKGDTTNVGGKPSVVLTGQGNFTGEKREYFEVLALTLTDEMLQPIKNVIYNGGEWEPALVVKAGEDVIPKENFEASYRDNIQAGQAGVLVKPATGNANVTGSMNGTFTIDKCSITLTVQDASKTVGDPDPEQFAVDAGQAAGGDTVTFDPAVREPGEDVGTYRIYIPEESVKISNEKYGDVTASYDVKLNDGTFTIEKAVVPDPSDDDSQGQGDSGNVPGPVKGNYDPMVGESPLFNKKAQDVSNQITKGSSEEGPKGTTFGLLQLKATKATKNQIKVTWKPVRGAKKYMVFASPCGRKNKFKYQLTTGKKAIAFKKISGKKLKKGTYYKFMVMAVDGNDKVIGLAKTIHVATSGKKVGNSKAVKLIKPRKKKLALKKGKTFKVKAKAIPASKKLKVKKHRALLYETTNRKIATVNKKGVIKGVKKGTCYVYIYAQNGVQSCIKVTIK